MKINNPLIRGFYPDPSVCSADGKYYMACSSFEYFPGVPLFESEDLINWKQIGHCLTRKTQVDLKGIASSGGVFAPTIRYNNGHFYMVTTNDTYHKNFYVYTDDIYGEWSEPVFVEQGGIDPSLFFEDGKAYFISNGIDPEDNNGCIFQCEIDISTGKKLTESRSVWKGSGGRYLESPHLYHFGDWYYLMAAEGGTEYGHMVTYARAKSPYGPFEPYPYNPVLTNRNLGGSQSIIQGIGHGELVQDGNGNTFMFCLGFRQSGMWQPFHHLGREVFIVPVQWNKDGWFTAGVDGTVQKEMELCTDAELCNCSSFNGNHNNNYNVSFNNMDINSLRWCHLREYDQENYKFEDGCLYLRGIKTSLCDTGAPTFAGIRQSEFNTELNVDVQSDAMEAGITFYLCEKHHYDLAVYNNEHKKSVILRLCIGDAMQVVKEEEFAEDTDIASLRVVSDNESYSFYTKCGNAEVFMGKAASKYLSSEVAGGFTGTIMAMYAVNREDNEDKWAVFSGLDWKQKRI